MKRVAATALLAMGLVHGAATVSQDARGKSDEQADSRAAARTAARGLDRVATLARQDLANRLHLDVQHVRVANVEPRRWTDDDMNCASGGGTPATEAPTAAAGSASAVGYRLALSASGRTYFYHTDLRSVRACPPSL
jgi:hypothetical protein